MFMRLPYERLKGGPGLHNTPRAQGALLHPPTYEETATGDMEDGANRWNQRTARGGGESTHEAGTTAGESAVVRLLTPHPLRKQRESDENAANNTSCGSELFTWTLRGHEQWHPRSARSMCDDLHARTTRR